MEDDSHMLDDMERSYLQLVRVSDEIHQELSKRNQLVTDSYKKYLIESQQLIAQWQVSSEKSRAITHEKELDPNYKERFESLKKNFIRNMEGVRVRLDYLDPVKQFLDKGRHLAKKYQHYLTLKNEISRRHSEKQEREQVDRELSNTKIAIEALIKEPCPENRESTNLKEKLALLLLS